ncbi:HNH endonuclease [Pirellulales bacterium]|nr:HNH endonuclease [Pirellulales bacterium]
MKTKLSAQSATKLIRTKDRLSNQVEDLEEKKRQEKYSRSHEDEYVRKLNTAGFPVDSLCRYDLADIQSKINSINGEISCIENELRSPKREKQEQIRALATANTDDVRSAASTVKRKLGVDHDCPYCGLELGPDYHADHIYPVAKGGKSTFKNMVNVCRTCNSKKVALTLGVFCRKLGLNRDAIELRLDALGKDF